MLHAFNSGKMKKCGIIGGAGPGATLDLFRSIIIHTPAARDQDHIRIIIDNHPQIPDRTEALLHGGESPERHLKESVRLLLDAGVDFIVCPCNTAHVFLRRMKTEMDFTFIDMIVETVKTLHANKIRKAGLLSTSGTAKTGIYQETAVDYGIEIIIPSEDEIRSEMEAIYGMEGIKAGARYEKTKKNKSIFLEIINSLSIKGAEAIIMGCTEIPICLSPEDTSVKLINPTDVLARSVVDYALKQ